MQPKPQTKLSRESVARNGPRGIVNLPVEVFIEVRGWFRRSHVIFVPAILLWLAAPASCFATRFWAGLPFTSGNVPSVTCPGFHLVRGGCVNLSTQDYSFPSIARCVAVPRRLNRIRTCGFGSVRRAEGPNTKPNNKKSAKNTPAKQAYFLVKDVEEVFRTQQQLMRACDEQGLLRWISNRRDEITAKLEDSHMINRYLESADIFSVRQSDSAKRERRQIICERLKELGWTDEDMLFDEDWAKNWNSLIENKRLLPEDAWAIALPSLNSVLGTNRGCRAGRAEYKRLQSELQHLQDLFTHFKRTTHPFASVLCAVGIDLSRPLETFPDPFHESCVELQNPFPENATALKWECCNNIPDFSLDHAETDRLFKERRTQMEDHLVGWRTELERCLVEKFQAGTGGTGDVILTVKGDTNLTAHFSADTRFLLRADTIFQHPLTNPTYHLPWFYPGFLSSPSDSRFTYQAVHGYQNPDSRIYKLAMSVDEWNPHTDAQMIAKAILKGLDMPDVTHFELLALGKRFA
ncbi:hypothetical protein FRC10_010473, partial [Ceratobasidium sp. 414]